MGGMRTRAGWGVWVQDPTPLCSWGFDPPWSSLLPTAWTLSARDVAELVTAIPRCCPRCSRLLRVGQGQGHEQRVEECSLLGPACQDSPRGSCPEVKVTAASPRLWKCRGTSWRPGDVKR